MQRNLFLLLLLSFGILPLAGPLFQQTALATEATSATPDAFTISPGYLTPDFQPERLNYVIYQDELPADGEILIESGASSDNPALIRLLTMEGKLLQTCVAPCRVSLTVGTRVQIETATESDAVPKTYSLLALPSDFPDIVVDDFGGETAPGYFFIANRINADVDYPYYLMILDDEAVPLWYRRLDREAWDFKLQPNGLLSYFSWEDYEFIVMDSNFNTVDQYAPIDDNEDLENDHHEFVMLENDHAFMIGLAHRSADMTAYGGPQNCTILHSVVQEVDEDHHVVFESNTEDYLTFEDLPAGAFVFEGNVLEVAHLNSVDIDPNDDNMIVSIRHTSQVIKIARHSGTFNGQAYETGDVIWRLGGIRNDFTFINDPREYNQDGFSMQHCARFTDSGKLIVFDNAWSFDYGALGGARYAEYELDYDNMTATLMNEYETDYAAEWLGSVQKMDNGGVVIGWGSLDTGVTGPWRVLTELDSDLNEVLTMSLPNGENSYRAFKFEFTIGDDPDDDGDDDEEDDDEDDEMPTDDEGCGC